MAEPDTNDRPPDDPSAPAQRPFARFREVPLAAALVVIFGGLLLTLGDHITGREVGAYVSPRFWPRVLLLLGLALSVVYLARTVLEGVRARPAAAAVGRGGDAVDTVTGSSRASLGKLGGAAGLLLAYMVLMQIIGFVPVTLLFTVAFLLLTGERRWWLLVGLPVVIVAVVLATFTRLLVVPLPRGIGPFLEFSTWLY